MSAAAVRADGLCAGPGCRKVRPEAAVKAGDPFCSRQCAVAGQPPLVEVTGRSITGLPNGQRSGGRPKEWTRENVVAAIRRWAAEHEGEPPKSTEWAKSPPGWPNMTSVVRVFGKWSEAISAAGFDPGHHQRKARGNLVPREPKESQRKPEARRVALVPQRGREPLTLAQIPYDAERLSDEAAFLRHRAAALEQIADGIRKLAEIPA